MSAVKNLIIASLLTIGIGVPSGVAAANAVKNKSLTKTVAEITEENNNLKNDIENKDILITIKNNQLKAYKTGLFASNTDNLIKSWSQLFIDGDITYTNGSLMIVNKELSGDLICGNVDNLTNLELCFESCSKLTSIDLTNLDTSNVVKMNGLFANCSNLTKINFDNFKTQNVTNMNSMFSYCTNLQELNLSNFDTSNVTDMGAMFACCLKLQNLNISNWDTSNVEDMSSMFSNCQNIRNLDLSNFNTSKVNNMNAMFSSCKNLDYLNLSNFNTSNVTDITFMFAYCQKLLELDISNFNVSKVTTAERCFEDCLNLSFVNFGGSINDWEKLNLTTNVTAINSHFANDMITIQCNDGCISILTTRESLFQKDFLQYNTKILDVSHINFYSIENLEECFSNFFGYKMYVGNLDFSNNANINNMFANCENLNEIVYARTIEEWKAKNITNATTGIKEDGTVTVHCSDGDYVITAS